MLTLKKMYKSFDTLINGPSVIDELSQELNKDLSLQNSLKIKKLLRIAALTPHSIPLSLLTYPIVLNTLKKFSQETPFDKTLVYNQDFSAPLKPGEVRYRIVMWIIRDIFKFEDRIYRVECIVLDATLKRHRFCQDLSNAVPRTYMDRHIKDIVEYLIDDQLKFTNLPLITQSIDLLNTHYFNLSNGYLNEFNRSLNKEALKKSAEYALHLSCQEGFYDDFKTLVIETYLAQDTTFLKTIPAVLFHNNKSSHLHPKKTFEGIEKERAQRAYGVWI